MDINRTRFHLVLGEGWRDPAKVDGNLTYDEQSGLVSLEAKLFRFSRPKSDTPNYDARRGAARDQYGNWYWIGPDRATIYHRPKGGETRLWWAPPLEPLSNLPANGEFGALEAPAPTITELGGLTVTTEHYLVAGVLSPPGLLVVDLHAGGAPTLYAWPHAIPFAPHDLSATADGGFYLTDRIHTRLWRLDRHLQVCGESDQLLEPGGADPFQDASLLATPDPEKQPGYRVRPEIKFPTGVALAFDPVAVSALPDGGCLVLGATDQLYHLKDGAVVDSWHFVIEGDALAPPEANKAPLAVQDIAYYDGLLYAVGVDGNQAFAYQLTDHGLVLQRRFLPMRFFGEKGLVAASDGVYYDQGEGWAPLLAQERPRFAESGILLLGPFDGKEPRTVWHRLLLDGTIPPETRVEVESRAADSIGLLAEAPWVTEPLPYLRPTGSEIPYATALPPGEGRGTWDLLFQRAMGQYLELRLTLVGTGRATPRLWALRAYYPRFSYLREYLPAVYQEDPVSASFLDRFLANPEGILTTLEDRMAALQELFDLRTAPAEYLDWLATWFGTILDPTWDEGRRRLFLRHAPQLFQERGTVGGLVRLIRLATEPCVDDSLFAGKVSRPGGIRIREEFTARRERAAPTPTKATWQGFLWRRYRRVEALNQAWSTNYAEWSAIPLPAETSTIPDWVDYKERYLPADAAAHQFTVLLPTRELLGGGGPDPGLVARVVTAAKPAHTGFSIQEYWALCVVGSARLGEDTVVDRGARLLPAVVDGSPIAYSFLSYRPPWDQPDRRVVGRDRVQ